jgi:3-phenylpropionate/trans-cinnamate dioxygenase ferredoxin reductase subunit
VALDGGITVPADFVLVGIGAVPETTLAAAAGLLIENGIVVDDRLATSDPAIFAAGDCAAFHHPGYGRRIRLESWRSAQEQGALAARNMLGAGEAVSAVPWFWSDQYDLTLQIAGLAEGAVTTVRRPVGEGFVLFHLGPDGRLLAASGIGPGNAIAKDVRLAEMMIARGAHPDPEALATAPNLKKLLAG